MVLHPSLEGVTKKQGHCSFGHLLVLRERQQIFIQVSQDPFSAITCHMCRCVVQKGESLASCLRSLLSLRPNLHGFEILSKILFHHRIELGRLTLCPQSWEKGKPSLSAILAALVSGFPKAVHFFAFWVLSDNCISVRLSISEDSSSWSHQGHWQEVERLIERPVPPESRDRTRIEKNRCAVWVKLVCQISTECAIRSLYVFNTLNGQIQHWSVLKWACSAVSTLTLKLYETVWHTTCASFSSAH